MFLLLFPPFKVGHVDYGWGFLFAPPVTGLPLRYLLDLPLLLAELGLILSVGGLAVYLTRTEGHWWGLPVSAGRQPDGGRREAHKDAVKVRPQSHTRWLAFWSYVCLPGAGVGTIWFALRFFPNHFLVGLLLIIVGVGFGVLALGLHFRELWAWQWNWVVIVIPWIAEPSSPPGTPNTEILAKAAIFSLMMIIIWVWPNYMYWNRRTSLFLQRKSDKIRLSFTQPRLLNIVLTYLGLTLILAFPRNNTQWISSFFPDLKPHQASYRVPPPRIAGPAEHREAPQEATNPNPRPVEPLAKQVRPKPRPPERDIRKLGYRNILEVIRAGDLTALDIFLIDNQPNHPLNGSTLLIEAVKADQAGLVSRLLEKGANPRQTDIYGRTPYMYAQARNNPKILMLLGGQAIPGADPGEKPDLGPSDLPRWVHDGDGNWRRN